MVRRLCLVVLFAFMFLLIVPFVLAQDKVNTQITLMTEPNSRVWLIIKDQTTMRTIGSYNTTIGESGEKTLVPFASTPRMLSFEVNVYKSNSLIKSKNFSGFTAGSPVTLDLNVEEEPSENETEVSENQTELSQNVSETNETTGVTGKVTSGIVNLKIIYYVGGVILALVIIFVVYNIMQRRTTGFTITKLSEKLGKEKETGKLYSNDKDLREAEKKLEDVQKELEKIRNIKEAERKFDEARKELEKLRGK